MKNFEMRCTAEGTSALKLKFEHQVAEPSNIIAFPGKIDLRELAAGIPAASGDMPSTHDLRTRFFNSEMARSLRYGSFGGQPYGRIESRQAIVADIVFASFALGGVLLGL